MACRLSRQYEAALGRLFEPGSAAMVGIGWLGETKFDLFACLPDRAKLRFPLKAWWLG